MFEQAFLSISKKMQLSQVFYKRDTLKNFAKFTGKLASRSLFFNKVGGLRSGTFLKMRLNKGISPRSLPNLKGHLFYRTSSGS